VVSVRKEDKLAKKRKESEVKNGDVLASPEEELVTVGKISFIGYDFDPNVVDQDQIFKVLDEIDRNGDVFVVVPRRVIS
jgi:hypothetical protein